MMKSVYPWASPLGIRSEHIKSWRKECPPEMPFILWILQNKKINEDQYLLWAKNYYQLPILKKNFFEKNKPPIQLFKKYSSIWPIHILPIIIRKDILFIACLEPPKHFKPPQAAKFILCPLTLMAQWRPELQRSIAPPSLKLANKKTQPPPLKPTPPLPITLQNKKRTTQNKVPTTPPLPPSNSNVLPLEPKLKSSAESVFDIALVRTQNYFYSSMILICRDKKIIPSYWNGDWAKPSTIKPIDYSSPCIFKIVMQTKYPFHGKPRPSASNDKFFQDWTKGVYPEHVTLVPIFIEQKIYGILLGCTSKIRATKFQLKHVESLAQQVGKKIIILKMVN